MTLKAVFLDVGNTLVREEPSRFEIYAEAAARRGVTVEPGAMKELMRRVHHALPAEIDGGFRYSDPWFRAYIARIFEGELGLAAGSAAGIAAELFERFEDPATFRLFPGAEELLDELGARGIRVGVISNWSARLPRVLARLGVKDRIDPLLCSAIERMEKPDPAIFHAALERAHARPDEALHAGDHLEKDVVAASSLGLSAVWVRHGHPPGRNGAGELPSGCTLVRDLGELRADVLSRIDS